MAEEKDADELAQEEAEGYEMPPLPPIPLQLGTSEGNARPNQREPGAWCRENNVTPPPGSFESTGTALATSPAEDGETKQVRSPNGHAPDGHAPDGRRIEVPQGDPVPTRDGTT
jgi:phospholipid/cholesterol/gamma-HCH transport system ATP-binding protein